MLTPSFSVKLDLDLVRYLYNLDISIFFFYLCTVHFEIYAVQTPTNLLTWLRVLNSYIKIHNNIDSTCFGL